MKRAVVIFALVFSWTTAARGDFIKYRLPGSGGSILLEGKSRYNPGGTITFSHTLGTLYFSHTDIDGKPIVAQTALAQYGNLIRQAKDADSAMAAARFALKHGLVSKFKEGVKKALAFDSQHNDALAVRELESKLNVDLGESEREEKELREMVRNPSMKIRKTQHFILLHDTPDKAPKSFSTKASPRKPRAVERTELLERVYEVFLYKFYSQGVKLDIPQERLKVVLFNKESDYNRFATSIDPSLSSAIGFYDPKSNISFFFDHGSSDHLKPLRDLRNVMQGQAAELRKAGPNVAVKLGNTVMEKKDYIRMAETISLLVEIDHVNADIEVVSHEATHQISANTGLFPRDVFVPSWVHEGLATYFEAPGEATWAGMGAVNEERINWYRGLQADRTHSSLDFVCGDEIFSLAATHGGTLHAYGQAWALTHFMVNQHFNELMAYYRRLGEMPPDVVFNPDLLRKLFYETVKIDPQQLEREWKSYMSTLKTDTENIFGDDFR